MVSFARRLSFAALFVVVTSSCAHEPFVWVDTLPEESYERTAYRIRPGDRVHVRIWNQDSLQTEGRVRPDGVLTMPLIGDVAVAGLTPTESAKTIQSRLEGIVLDPRVSVAVSEGRVDRVTILGEVRTPGQYALEDSDNILHLLAKAGGLTPFADEDAIYVIRRNPAPLRIRFRWGDVATGKGRGLEFVLKDGDIVIVE